MLDDNILFSHVWLKAYMRRVVFFALIATTLGLDNFNRYSQSCVDSTGHVIVGEEDRCRNMLESLKCAFINEIDTLTPGTLDLSANDCVALQSYTESVFAIDCSLALFTGVTVSCSSPYAITETCLDTKLGDTLTLSSHVPRPVSPLVQQRCSTDVAD